MPQRGFDRLVAVLRNLKYMPAMVRMMIDLVDAQEDAARQDYLSAERRLIRIYSFAPAAAVARSTTNLLMALVSLRLGNLEAAAELAPTAISHVRSLRAFANPAERAYLQYVGLLIFEEATRRLGTPKSLDIGMDYEDLDLQKVRGSLRDAYPLHHVGAAVAPQIH
jgi:hypothetical protein